MSNTFVLVTDSGCDLPYDYLAEKGIPCVNLAFHFEGEDENLENNELDPKVFYEKMRAGEIARTSAANPEAFRVAFEKILKEGKDILYIGFDSGISSTVNSGAMAANELTEEYPDRTILVIDTLCASTGEGMVVAETQKRIENGMTLQEAYEFAKDLSPKVAHRFTVDTLTYLCRGGRVSKTAAFAGNILNIKPVLHVDDEGKLMPLGKVRGRQKSIAMLADAYGETAVQDSEYGIYISQGDCMEDAEYLAGLLKERYGKSVTMISYVGTVIGSHSGPGTLALFFEATARK